MAETGSKPDMRQQLFLHQQAHDSNARSIETPDEIRTRGASLPCPINGFAASSVPDVPIRCPRISLVLVPMTRMLPARRSAGFNQLAQNRFQRLPQTVAMNGTLCITHRLHSALSPKDMLWMHCESSSDALTLLIRSMANAFENGFPARYSRFLLLHQVQQHVRPSQARSYHYAHVSLSRRTDHAQEHSGCQELYSRQWTSRCLFRKSEYLCQLRLRQLVRKPEAHNQDNRRSLHNCSRNHRLHDLMIQ